MIRRKRGDTTIREIEATYDINLNARSDMLLRNLLEERGFDSLTQLLQAYRGRLYEHPRRRRIFLSFHSEDLQQVRGFRLMCMNAGLDLDLADVSPKAAINSENLSYIRLKLKESLKKSSVVICLIGNGTARRDWVDWELKTAIEMNKGIAGIVLKNSRGWRPPILKQINASVACWDQREMTAAIERAAARRS